MIEAHIPLLKAVFDDLNSIFNSNDGRAAEAAYQMAICYFHGCGVERDTSMGLKWLTVAASKGCLQAQCSIVPAHHAYKVNIPASTRADTLSQLCAIYPYYNNRMVGAVISQTNESIYKQALKQTRIGRADILSHERYRFKQCHSTEQKAVRLEQVGSENILNILPAFGLTTLQYACLRALPRQEVRALLNKSTINATTSMGHTALWFCCNCGNHELTRLLLSYGATAATSDFREGLTPLHFLSRFDSCHIESIAGLLIEAGADVNAVALTGETPLSYVLDAQRNFCAFSGEFAARTLLKMGATAVSDDMSIATMCSASQPLGRALILCEPSVLIPILESIQDWVHETTVVRGLQKLLVTKKRRSESLDVGAEFLANLSGRVYMLILSKPPWYRINSLGSRYTESLRTIIAWLLSHGARESLASMGTTALARSLSNHQHDITNVILDSNLFEVQEVVDVNCLFNAMSMRNLDLVKRLWDLGVDFSQEDEDGKTFLHQAAATGWTVTNLQVITNLVQEKVDLYKLAHSIDAAGNTPFDLCVIHGYFHLADYLTFFGVAIDDHHFSQDISGTLWTMTLLGRCLVLQDDEILKMRQARYLLKFDPSFVVCPTDGSTALTSCWTPWPKQRKRCKTPKSICCSFIVD